MVNENSKYRKSGPASTLSFWKGGEVLNKAGYVSRTEEIAEEIAKELGFELVDVEFEKEGSDYYLRVYIDKEGGITVDDCEAFSRRLDGPLDREDYISESYILEVSSPGLTRPLKKDRDFERSIGKLVEVKLFKAVDGRKEFELELEGFNDKEIMLRSENGTIGLARADISSIRLAFTD